MRYLIFVLALGSLALLLLCAGCRKTVNADGPTTAGASSAGELAKTTQEQEDIKKRIERPQFKRPEWNPPAPYRGKCANCNQDSDKLNALDPFNKEIGGVCSEKCQREWLAKNSIVSGDDAGGGTKPPVTP